MYVSMQIVACHFYKTYNVLVAQFVLNPVLQPVLFIFSGNSVKKNCTSKKFILKYEKNKCFI